MTTKSTKLQINLLIDLFLFFLLSIVITAVLIEHILPKDAKHAQFMFHAIHGLAGIAMSITIGVHLVLHFPWIKSQVKRLLNQKS